MHVDPTEGQNRQVTTIVHVARVIDGDTFETTDGEIVRLEGYDAPETGTRGGAEATQILRNLVEGKFVSVDVLTKDVYGRFIAKVALNGISINKAMQDYTNQI